MLKVEKVMELAFRRGFLWPSYEIYGGVSGFYDYGPLGATLKKRLEDKWREYYCIKEGYLEIFSPAVSPEEVFIASGHVKSFVDPLVECLKCNEVYRADVFLKDVLKIQTDGLSFEELEDLIKNNNVKCSSCKGPLGEVYSYNLMFKTHIGTGNKKIGYLRPETAQGMFLQYNRLYEFYRKKLPFGVAQLGKAYRNEISPRQGVVRLREFNQAEVEIFVNPKEKTHPNFPEIADTKIFLVPQKIEPTNIKAKDAVEKKIVAHELLTYQLVLVKNFLLDVGIKEDNIRFRQHLKTEMAHYAADCWDAEVHTKRFGWIEVVGIADRTNYDLTSHMELSKADLTAFIQFDKSEKKIENKFQLDMGKIGPKYKNLSEEISKTVEKLGQNEMSFFRKHGYVEVQISKKKIRLTQQEIRLHSEEKTVSGEKIIPHVIEPSFGIDRIIYCVLESAYCEEGERHYLSLKKYLAPVQVAIFPLVSKDNLPQIAFKIFEDLRKAGVATTYDEEGSIGRRYARVDEIGVPYVVTVDFKSQKNSVTIRERDSTVQIRVKKDKLRKTLVGLLNGSLKFQNLV